MLELKIKNIAYIFFVTTCQRMRWRRCQQGAELSLDCGEQGYDQGGGEKATITVAVTKHLTTTVMRAVVTTTAMKAVEITTAMKAVEIITVMKKHQTTVVMKAARMITAMKVKPEAAGGNNYGNNDAYANNSAGNNYGNNESLDDAGENINSADSYEGW